MNKKTRNALMGSIKKWERIAADEGVDRGQDNCPLCVEFYFDVRRKAYCVHCPVFWNTGVDGCQNTPYQKWTQHQVDVHGNWGIVLGWGIKPGCRTYKRLANAEAKFLKGLEEKVA